MEPVNDTKLLADFRYPYRLHGVRRVRLKVAADAGDQIGSLICHGAH